MHPKASTAQAARPDFPALWNRLLRAAASVEDERTKATLLNHSSRKEQILRRLGVVSEADVRRYEQRARGG